MSEVEINIWRELVTGPAAAGAFTVVAASIAYLAALRSSQEARRGAQRNEWWARAEWALARVASDAGAWRASGFRACAALMEEATPTEAEIVGAVIDEHLSRQPTETAIEGAGETNVESLPPE